jgi:hypothetical protein
VKLFYKRIDATSSKRAPLSSIGRSIITTISACLLVGWLVVGVSATTWSGIEPLKSRRADVERVLGKPIVDKPGDSGTLRFKVSGGIVTIVFVDSVFATNKKLSLATIGTVRQIVLQHEKSSDTPESMGLVTNKKFQSDSQGIATFYRNMTDGIDYTFINGQLKTSYYTPSSEQWSRAQRR